MSVVHWLSVLLLFFTTLVSARSVINKNDGKINPFDDINLKFTCGETIDYNSSYFCNPSNLDPTVPCEITVRKVDSNVCQLRLDFDTFVLAGPEGTGGPPPTGYAACLDQFMVVPNTMGPICGTNTGSHMYVEASSVSEVKIYVTFDSGTVTSRQWNILVSQIPCGATYAAPSGCNQYYTDFSGTISSYNYQPSSTSAAHIQELQQVICIRSYDGFCSITYSAVDFDITGDAADTVATGGTDCTEDYVIIVGGEYTDNTGTTGSADRFCGSLTTEPVQLTVTSNIRPHMVTFVTQTFDTVGTAPGIGGFSFTYTQGVCVEKVE